MAGEALHVADDDLVRVRAESPLQGLHLGGGAAAAGRGVGFVRHEHCLRGEVALVQAVHLLDLRNEFRHHVGDVLGVQPAHVVGAVGGFRGEYPHQRLHAARPYDRLVLYHQAHRA